MHPYTSKNGVTTFLARGRECLIDTKDWNAYHRWVHAGYELRIRPRDHEWTFHSQRSYTHLAIGLSRNGVEATVLLHRLLLNVTPGQFGDHKNHNTLDNRRCNLRIATRSQNNANRRMIKKTKTGLKGVKRNGTGGRFSASISKDKVAHYLGTFDTPEQAAIAYNEAAIRLFGEFALLNEIPQLVDG